MKKKKTTRAKKSTKLVDHDDFMIENLKDPKYAAAYLDSCFLEAGPDRLDLILDAFRLLVKAHGYTELSRISGISRRTLYDAFSDKGNPTAETLLAVLEATGLSLSVKAKGKKRA